MIKSMTGFASTSREDDVATISVTVRSVNHRYLDVQVRVPHVLAELEQDLRGLVRKQIARGRVELSVNLRLKTPPLVALDLNMSLVEALAQAAEKAAEQGWVGEGLSAGELLRFPNVATVREQPVDEDTWRAVCDAVTTAAGEALDELDQMRRREGEFLHVDLDERAAALGALLDQIVAETTAGEAALRERLSTRLAELGMTVETDAAAVAQEIVRWVARSDIHEEVARLHGHLEHLDGLAKAGDPCGRTLDFLVQEMNREVNTIGSKAEGLATGQLVVAAKAELEKLREQLQNAE